MILIALSVVALVTLYIYSTRNFKYWQVRGVKHDKPIPLFGNNIQNYLMRKSMTTIAVDVYRKFPDERVVGFFRSSKPELVIRDPELIKRILTTDFYNFCFRGLCPHKEVVEPLMRNLFFADGDLWRLLRQRMTPAFTSGKLKAMFPLVCDRAERLQAVLSAATVGKPKTLDAREVMARYSTDFIGSVGFGLESDSLNDENSAFRKLGRDIFNTSISEFLTAVAKEVFPIIFKHFKYFKKIEKDLIELVIEIQKQRNYQPSGRNDFIDLLLECRRKGAMAGESIEKVQKDGKPVITSVEMDDELVAAQVFIFFAAGFETSSSSASFTLHQLAFHPEIQRKVQEDIDRVLSQYDGKLCYDAVKEMTYLDCAFKESMRVFPSVGFLIRECSRQYTIPETNVTIDPGVGVIIPVQALHMDPQYFENPEEFRPERFSSKELDKDAIKFVFLPFGEGPRACIGERLGMMQSLAGLAAILSKFTVEPAPETTRHPVADPKSTIIQIVKDGIPLVFRERVKI